MNYQAVEETIRAGYRAVTSQYRRDDEIEVTTPNHRRISATLREICGAFPDAIKVLDVGCGTGRYFHCLVNVETLTGVDITDEMLKEAKRPVRCEEVTARNIRLLRGNIYSAEFPARSFHLIYSLGMFGNGCPVTAGICNKFHEWLLPGGVLFFNTVDVAGLPFWYRARRRARRTVYPMLPQRWKTIFDEREARHPFCGTSLKGLEAVLCASRFRDFQVRSRVCESPLWNGRHLECIATKTDES